MSKEVKRYELRIVDRYAGDGTGDIETDARMKQEAKGRYVLFSDYEALLAERDRMAAALKASRAATPSLTCESFHHERRDLHGHDEECPPFERWIAAALACNAALQGDQP